MTAFGDLAHIPKQALKENWQIRGPVDLPHIIVALILMSRISALALAIESCDLDECRSLLSQGDRRAQLLSRTPLDVESGKPWLTGGATPLIQAIYKEDAAIVRELLSSHHEEQVMQRRIDDDGLGGTPLIQLAYDNYDLDIARALLERSPVEQVLARDNLGQTALMIAVERNSGVEFIEELLKSVPCEQVAARDHTGRTALVRACGDFRLDVVQVLLRYETAMQDTPGALQALLDAQEPPEWMLDGQCRIAKIKNLLRHALQKELEKLDKQTKRVTKAIKDASLTRTKSGRPTTIQNYARFA